MNRAFEWLFKYPPVVFERGDFSFAALSSASAWMAIVAATAGGAYLFVLGGRRPLPRRANALLLALRASALALVIFCLLQPVLTVPAVIPRSATIALLVDDSLSMTIPDVRGRPRAEIVRELLSSESSFRRALESKFQVRLFSLSGEELSPSARAPRTDLGAGLERILAGLPGDSLSAVILLSDGAHNVKRDVTPLLSQFVARRIPIYPLGMGEERIPGDVELVRVNVPRRILLGSSVRADLLLRCGRAAHRRMTVRVIEQGQTLQAQEVECATETHAISLEFTPREAGIHRYTFLVEPQAPDVIPQNNRLESVVEVRDEPVRVLYIEGEPRWEYGKLRAAVADDERLHLVSVVRTAQGKFYRQGVESGQELIRGFPERPEELFRFHGLILGSVEAGFFTREQLEQMEAFVGRRGGGLLMLGGRRSFSAGGYALTPLADVLPVELRRPSEISREPETEVVTYVPALTEAGREHPITRLKADRAANERAWRALPPVSVPEVFTRAKPGAIVLLEGVRRSRGGPRPLLLAVHRYGRGLSLAFTPSDSWRWQMQMPLADLSHEAFWKQMLRYLVSLAEDPVNLLPDADAYEVGDELPFRVEVRDELFRPVREAAVEVTVQTPRGAIERVSLSPSLESEGEYVGVLVVGEPGIYRLRAQAQHHGRQLGQAEAHVIVREPDREYRGAGQNVEFLKWLARETDGRYHPVEDAERLPPELEYSAGEHSILVTRELWDMPITFLLLISLLSLEWALRRRYGVI